MSHCFFPYIYIFSIYFKWHCFSVLNRVCFFTQTFRTPYRSHSHGWQQSESVAIVKTNEHNIVYIYKIQMKISESWLNNGFVQNTNGRNSATQNDKRIFLALWKDFSWREERKTAGTSPGNSYSVRARIHWSKSMWHTLRSVKVTRMVYYS